MKPDHSGSRSPHGGDADVSAAREEALVAAWRTGDVAAFEEIVRRYRRRLFAVALRSAGSAEAAEDSVQVALHNAFRGISRLDGKIDVGPWLMTIVRNAAINETRTERRHQRIAKGASEFAVATETHGTSGPVETRLDRMERLELGRILHEGIASLPAPYRSALELFHVHGLGVAEIGQVLSLNVGTVKTHLARGRGLLQRRLERRLRDGGYL